MSSGVSRLFLLIFATLISVAAFLHFAFKRSAEPARHLGGTEAPILQDLVMPAETVTVIPADRIGTGEVLEVVQRAQFTYVLHSDQWIRTNGHFIYGPYGRGAEGAPGVFSNASDILPTDTLVYVLERLPSRILAYRHDGTYVRTISVRSGDSTSIYVNPERFALVNGEFRVLLTHFNPTGYVNRELVSSAGDSWHRLYWLDADSLEHMSDDVLLDARGELVAMLTMLGYRLRRIKSADSVRVSQREDPPRYSIPDSIRWDFQRTFASAPKELRDRLTLPEIIPPARAFSLLGDAHVVVAVSRDMEAAGIEVLDVNAAPVWRSDEVFDMPIFLHGDQLFRLDEQPNHLVILRHRVKGAAEWPK